MSTTAAAPRRLRHYALRTALNEREALRMLALFANQQEVSKATLKRFHPNTPYEKKLRRAGLIRIAAPDRPMFLIVAEPAAPLADWLSQQELGIVTVARATLRRIQAANFNGLRASVIIQAYENGGTMPNSTKIHESNQIRDSILTALRSSEVIVDRQLTPLGLALAQWYV